MATIQDLIHISHSVGTITDLTQGGGGNTSVKLDDTKMAVKASGCLLSDMRDDYGYVILDYPELRRYYASVDFSSGTDYEKDATVKAQSCILPVEGLPSMRPSVEAGFHALLRDVVVHTHPVWANILNCAAEGKAAAEKLRQAGVDFIWLPYINPGFTLTLRMGEALAAARAEGRNVQVIFMQNHGLVVTADTAEECLKLHGDVVALIQKTFNIPSAFPVVTLEGEDGAVVSKTAGLVEFFRLRNWTREDFTRYALYPDQLVYINGNLGETLTDGKMKLDLEAGTLTYTTTMKEARAIEETLTGYAEVLRHIAGLGWTAQDMGEEGMSFIQNWESEKYRKSMVK